MLFLACAGCDQQLEYRSKTCCAKCHVGYCSKECQETHKNDHKKICKKIQRHGGKEKYTADVQSAEIATIAVKLYGEEGDSTTCSICEQRGDEPILRACGCSGTSGLAHLSCLVRRAQIAMGLAHAAGGSSLTRQAPRSPFLRLGMELLTATAVTWNRGGRVRVKGRSILATFTAHLELATAKEGSFAFRSNVEARFQPASHVSLAACDLAADVDPFEKTRGPLQCLEPQEDSRSSCLLAQDLQYPFLFQHALIDSVPTHGLARLVQEFLLPAATLVCGDKKMRRGAQEEDLQDWRSSGCGLSNGRRRWVFLGTGLETRRAHLDCFPVGTFDWFRKSAAAPIRGADLLYAARRTRAPRQQAALEAWLRALATDLGLRFTKVAHDTSPALTREAFRTARLVVGVHGGALANLVYAHESTVVLEIGKAQGRGPRGPRWCYACMAFAMRFPLYAVFHVRDFSYDAQTFELDVAAVRTFWEEEVRGRFDELSIP